MSRRALLSVAVGAALFLIGVAVMLKASESTTTTSVPVETAPPPATTATTATTTATTAPGPEAVGFAIEVANGTPVDGIQRVTASKGDTVTVEVSGAPGEELHLHGYDRTLELGADGAGTLTFEATLQGVFELELEHAGVQVGELTVR